jgi:hypothetical protein
MVDYGRNSKAYTGGFNDYGSIQTGIYRIHGGQPGA